MPSTNYKYYEDARTSYYERLIFPTGFQNFTEITRNNHSAVFKSNLPIQFKTLEFGDSEKIVAKKIGKPRFMCRDNGFSPMVYYYKEEVMGHSLLIQVHFFENEFVMATQSIIDTDLKWREIVKASVIEKYSGTNKQEAIDASGSTSIVFSDENGNKIFLLESINLNILYFSNDQKHYHHIENFTRLKIKRINDEVENLKALLKTSF